MRTFCFKNCRIKHLKIGFLFLSAIGAIILIIIPSVYTMSMINGGLLRGMSFGIGFLLGKQIYLHHPIGRCLAKLFPFSCGHRKRIFTGSSSMPLQAILLLIDSCLPTMEEMEQLKNDAMDFLCDIKTELEKEFTQTTFECIFSGSIEERFGIPYSHKKAVPSQFNALYTDFDIMFCCDFYNASFYSKGNVLIEHCRVDENYILPGFAKLRYFAHSPDEQLLDSNEFLQKVLKAVKCAKVEHLPGDSCAGACATDVSTTIRGPSVKVCVLFPDAIKKRFEGDITICIKCFEWPLISNWPIRESRSWPSTENVQEIASHGFHLVAKPLRYNREIIPVWRFSFSVAEIELSKLVPDTARKCFLALKVVLKDHLQPVFPELSSYHIKTIFLNTLEKMPENVWVDENIEECFLTLLKELQNALESGCCRHFWLKDVNLFTSFREEKRKMLKLLSTKVKRIIVDPAPFIYDDGCCCICSCCRCVTKKEHYDREESQNVLPVGDDTGGAEVKNQGTNRGYGTFLKAHEVV